MSRSDRSDPFPGWNLASSEGGPGVEPEPTQSWPGGRRRASEGGRAAGEVRPGGRPSSDGPGSLDPAAAFTLHPAQGGAGPGSPPAGETALVDRRPAGAISFPRPGEGIGGFRLLSELGRGAFGRVYLAEESGLGNRTVALKVTRPEGEEPRLLARLQHTHIVPVHSVVDDPGSGLRLMCMPYFGGANLAQVLEATGRRQVSIATATGLSLVEALDDVGGPPASDADRSARPPADRPGPGDAGPSIGRASSTPGPIPGRISWWSRSSSTPPGPVDGRDPVQPSRRLLRESSLVGASAWIVARLAEGLEHAHSRGLLHRDLKPSNILIAADGSPMLLDFNLAAEVVSPVQGERAMVGGTLPYMAPEHLDAFHPDGDTPPEAVDERADVYALGLILFEMIAGERPFPEPPPGRPLLEAVRAMTEERRGPAPSPRRSNPRVSRGLEAIVRKCLDPDPARRHARAGDLAEDLQRFLDDRPLKHTPEPSVAERATKWARRNPKITGAMPVALISLALMLLVGGVAWTLSHQLRRASARLKLGAFERDFLECQFLLNVDHGPSWGPGEGVRLADRAIEQAGITPGGDRARSWWTALPPEEQASIRGDLAELILLSSRVKVLQAGRSGSAEAARRALVEGVRELDRAERLDPHPPQALFAERAGYHSALGRAAEAARDRCRSESISPATGRDLSLIGTYFLARRQPDRAEAPLLKAIGLDPRRFWGWFALGLCHFDQSRFAESAGDFAVCAVLAPKFSWPWMNRGLALARAGRLVEARESYDRAVALDGRNAEARAHRGLASLELGDAPSALADLEGAVALGHRDPSIRAALGEAMARAGRRAEGLRLLGGLIEADPVAAMPRVARGMVLLATDPGLAEADFRRVLALDPRHAVANLGLARLLRATDPAASLRFADLAVTGDPGRVDALELRAWLRGRLGDPLAVDDVDLLIRTPTPHRLYNAACALALLSESRADPKLAGRALELLRRALESGFPAGPLRDDPDLKSLRSDPTFRGWIETGKLHLEVEKPGISKHVRSHAGTLSFESI